jgi:hypothetical protein
MKDNFKNICNEYSTDKQTYHEFCEFYEEFFKDKKDLNLNILEIGVNTGASILSLHDYFKNSKIYGMDIDYSRCQKINKERIQLNTLSQIDTDAIHSTYREIMFDIIIDDGSHIPSHQIASFEYLFLNKLNNGGIYICEDLHTNLNHLISLNDNMLFKLLFSNHDLVDKTYLFKNSHYKKNKDISITSVIIKGK